MDDASADFALEIVAELAQFDAIFRYPVSPSQTLDGNLISAMPNTLILGDTTRIDERQESSADARYLYRTSLGQDFYVYERAPKVWIDVSRLETGSRGNAVYHAVANYAFNTKRSFVGDPAGLSVDAIVRRTAAMLSSAIRLGTLKHFEPAVEQLMPSPEAGISPLIWRGSDHDKTKTLLLAFLDNLHAKYPSITNYRYDFRTKQFMDASSRPIGRERFSDGAKGHVARGARVGEASLRRGIFLQSLMASQSSERPAILEQFFRRAGELAQSRELKAVF